MSRKYIDTWVTIGLIVATVLCCLAIFLSSQAEAHRGDLNHPLSVYTTGDQRRLTTKLDRLSAIQFMPTQSAFERPQTPVRFIYVWPKLPTTTEQLIKTAQDRLADLVVRVQEEKAEKAKAVELTLAWDALWKGIGLFLMAVGTIITVVLGIGGATRRKRS